MESDLDFFTSSVTEHTKNINGGFSWRAFLKKEVEVSLFLGLSTLDFTCHSLSHGTIIFQGSEPTL